MTKLEHTPASGAVLGMIMAFADYDRRLAELAERVAALEKAAEPKPVEPPTGTHPRQIDDAYKAGVRYTDDALDRIKESLADANESRIGRARLWLELEKAFAAGVEFARERNPQADGDRAASNSEPNETDGE